MLRLRPVSLPCAAEADRPHSLRGVFARRAPIVEDWKAAEAVRAGSRMSLHIYTVQHQPYTRYVDEILVSMGYTRRKATTRNHPRSQRRCDYCGRRRWAKNLSVQVYYDMLRVFCTDWKGCR